MECPQCGKNEAFWVRGMDVSVYSCDACGHEFKVDLDRWDRDEKRSGQSRSGREYIVRKKTSD